MKKKVIKVRLGQEQSATIWGMLKVANAVNVIFQHGVEPREHDFHEFTCEQYQAFEMKMRPLAKGEKLFGWFFPKHGYVGHEILTLTGEEKEHMFAAAAVIEHCTAASGRIFESYTAKLRYAASQLLESYSAGTPFEHKESGAKLTACPKPAG